MNQLKHNTGEKRLKKVRDQSLPMIEYSTMPTEYLFKKKHQFLDLYKEFIKSKENYKFINFDTSKKLKRPSLNQMLSELSLYCPPQNKHHILKTQMKKYRNMTLYDKGRILPMHENLTTSATGYSRQSQMIKTTKEKPSRDIQDMNTTNSINTYSKILIQLACRDKSIQDKQSIYFSNQGSPDDKPVSKKGLSMVNTKKTIYVRASLTRIKQPLSPKIPQIKVITKKASESFIKQITHLKSNIQTMRGWDVNGSSQRSF